MKDGFCFDIWNDVEYAHTYWEVRAGGSWTVWRGDQHLEVISSMWVEIKVRAVGESPQKLHRWEEKRPGMKLWKIPPLRRRHACQGCLQGAAGEVGSEGGEVGVRIGTKQCFDEETGKVQVPRTSKKDQKRVGLSQIGHRQPRWVNEFCAGALCTWNEETLNWLIWSSHLTSMGLCLLIL